MQGSGAHEAAPAGADGGVSLVHGDASLMVFDEHWLFGLLKTIVVKVIKNTQSKKFDEF